MKEIQYEFVELDRNTSFGVFGKLFGGILENQTLFFDNEFGKGSITKLNVQLGLSMRNWEFTAHRKINLYKLPTGGVERKFCLVYLFDPAIMSVKNERRKISLNSRRNNIFFSNDVSLNFSATPKQPFSVIDFTFPQSWLLQEFHDAIGSLIHPLHSLDAKKSVLMIESCSMEEHKALHELKVCLLKGEHNPVFIRSRIYSLIWNFLNKLKNECRTKEPGCNLSAGQVLEIEKLFMENLSNAPSISTIAKKVNMSMPSLLRQFRLMYGKGIHEYFIERKMELAKKMILHRGLTIKTLSEIFGYKQSSPFIKTFARLHGFSPGTLNR